MTFAVGRVDQHHAPEIGQLRGASHANREAPCLRECGQQESDEHRHDRDADKQFDQREGMMRPRRAGARGGGSAMDGSGHQEDSKLKQEAVNHFRTAQPRGHPS